MEKEVAQECSLYFEVEWMHVVNEQEENNTKQEQITLQGA